MNQFSSSRFFGNIPPTVRNLIIVNAFVLLITWIMGKAGNDFMIENFALFYPGSSYFRPWQFITHIFMHANFWHLLFNMYALWLFGCALEYQWGSKKFLLFYLVTGVGAAMFYCLVLWFQVLHAESSIDPATLAQMKELLADRRILTTGSEAMTKWNEIMRTPMLGASGAVYGVLLGFGMLYPNVRFQLIFPPISLTAKWLVIIYGAIELVWGVSSPGDSIAHFAHLGGMLFAFILIKYWQKKGKMYEYR